MPSGALNCVGLAANEPMRERSRFGFVIEKAWCPMSVRTRSSVPCSGIIACNANHLSSTSGSAAWARKKESSACSRWLAPLRVIAASAPNMSVMLSASWNWRMARAPPSSPSAATSRSSAACFHGAPAGAGRVGRIGRRRQFVMGLPQAVGEGFAERLPDGARAPCGWRRGRRRAPSSRAISDSLGKASACAAKAGSARQFASNCAAASQKPAASCAVPPARMADAERMMSPVA